MMAYRHIDIKKYVNIKIENGLIIRSILIFVFAITLYYLNNLYLNIINLLIVCTYAFLTNKKLLFESLNTVKSKLKK